METRRVFQQAEFAHDRLADFIADTRAQASAMPEGAERTELLQRRTSFSAKRHRLH